MAILGKINMDLKLHFNFYDRNTENKHVMTSTIYISSQQNKMFRIF